jgi:dienelactone hydrolase
MEGYTSRSFAAEIQGGHRVEHTVYERGEGPPIVLIQELPGIGPETLRLAERLQAAGYRVVLPHLFGPLGRVALAGNAVRVLCMRREFDLFARNRSSPVVDWLRALCRDVRARCACRGVGVIGMCLTGNFAITLMGDESVLAAVASQPSLPALSPRALHMSEAEIEASKRALDARGPMLALRFDGDLLCSRTRQAAIEAAFNRDETRVRFEVLPGRRHAVLTLDFVDERGHPTHRALEAVLQYFEARLQAEARS